MRNENRNRVYIDMMVDTLQRKKNILMFLLEKTRQQETLLKDDEMNPDDFQALIDEKGTKIELLNQMDEGFDALFRSVEQEITSNREEYKEEILEMQKLIREVSELGIQVQALEHQNSGHFKVYLANQRKKIRDFHVNHRTASSYYKNMANAHKQEQSYFFNETK